MNAKSQIGVRSVGRNESLSVRDGGLAQPFLTELRAVGASLGYCSATVLFTDIVGFTPMTEKLGDRRALEVVRAHNSIVRDRVRAHAGREIRFQGDGFMVAFASTRRAVDCAIAIQRAFADPDVWTSDQELKLRIGINVGDAIPDGKELHGKSVIIAARIMAQALGGEILISSAVKERIVARGFAFDSGREKQLKGLNGKHRVHRVLYETGSAGSRVPWVGVG